MNVSEQFLAEVIEDARRRWPRVAVDAGAFESYLKERLESGASFDQLQKLDLFLACACAHGQAPAIAAFKELYLPQIESSLRALHAEPAVIDGVIYGLFEELFRHGREGPARITSYTGRSTLLAWLQVAAIRKALLVLEQDRPDEHARSNGREPLEASLADPELARLKVLYRDAFKPAFQEAVRGLSSRERLLLRYRYVEGLTSDEIARLYGIERAMAVCWQERACGALIEATRSRLMARAPVDRRECDGFTRWIQTELDTSIQELFPVERS